MNEHLELESLARALSSELGRRKRHGLRHVQPLPDQPPPPAVAAAPVKRAPKAPETRFSISASAPSGLSKEPESMPTVPKPTHRRPTRQPGSADIPGLRRMLAQCIDCGLSAGPRKSGALVGRGATRPALAFITDFPGPAERRYGKVLAPEAGQMIANMATKGFQLELSQIYLTAAVKCPLGQGCRPAPKQITACAKHLEKELELLRPRAIVAFGSLAAAALGYPATPDFNSLRGQVHHYKGKPPLVITLHPRDMLAEPSLKAGAWKDLQLLRPHLGGS